MNTLLTRLIPPVLLRSPSTPVCSVCGEALEDLPVLRIRGVVLHRDCLGYRARRLVRR
jgi:hypothetical protein